MRSLTYILLLGTAFPAGTALAESVPGVGAGIFTRNPRAYDPGPGDSTAPNSSSTSLKTHATVVRSFDTKRQVPLQWGSASGAAPEFELVVGAEPYQWVQLVLIPEVQLYRRLPMPEHLVDPRKTHSDKDSLTVDRITAGPGRGADGEGTVRLKVKAAPPKLKEGLPPGRYDGVMRGTVTWN